MEGKERLPVLCRDRDRIIKDGVAAGLTEEAAAGIADLRRTLDDEWLREAPAGTFIIKAVMEISVFAAMHDLVPSEVADVIRDAVGDYLEEEEAG